MITSPLPMPERAARYDQIEAVLADERFTNGQGSVAVRDYIIAVLWAYWTVPEGDRRTAIVRHLGLGGHADMRWRSLLRDDTPRFEPPPSPGCEHVLAGGPRKGERCGKRQALTFKVTDPETGEWRRSEWCAQHREPGRAAQWRESHRDKTSDATPHPNRGGLLPCYLTPDGSGWEERYRKVSPGWEPPAVGICADDWPILTRTMPVTRPRPRLTLVMGDLA